MIVQAQSGNPPPGPAGLCSKHCTPGRSLPQHSARMLYLYNSTQTLLEYIDELVLAWISICYLNCQTFSPRHKY